MNVKIFRTLAVMLLGLTVLQGCGSGSGAATSENPVTATASVSNYTGPAPSTADVQAFKLNLWDNLVANNRCGSCHNGDQNPRFVRSDDINLAYESANTVVNLADPQLSTMVAKVRGGHNCWLAEDNACADIIQSYIENWAGDSLGGAAKEVQLLAPPLQMPGTSKNFPDDSGLFATNVYPLLIAHCSGCHSDNAAIPQSPYFASADIEVAYEAVQSKIDLGTPANSRLVIRLGREFHNCWTNSCSNDGATMQTAITNMADDIDPDVVDPDLVTSMALGLPDGIVSSAGGRHETNVIALYEFKTGDGNQAYDTSGVEPSLNLTLSGDYDWVGGWGIALTDGKAQGSTTASAKLYDQITATGEFSVEAWVAPANVTQDGPARIVTYSGGSMSRNFMLGQTLYDYDSLVRSDVTDENGEPQVSTPSADELLQASLQHVVMTYDPVDGRQLYVNGELVDATDPLGGGLLNEWNNTFAFAIGSEVDNENGWAGTVRLLAVHNRVLSEAQILQNFEVGVGEKYFLLFNVSAHTGIDDAYVVFEVSQFDSYSYLFDAPFFVILDSAESPGTIPLEGMRIGINGREATVGQAYQNLDMQITDTAYDFQGRQYLSELGTIIPLEKGPDQDEFFLTFERLGSASNVVVEAAPTPPSAPPPVPRSEFAGIRDFAEVNATMSRMTGVPHTEPQVAQTYDLVYQAMPVQPSIAGFISSQQMGITQLAIKYCSTLVDNAGLRASFWPGFNWNAPLATAFSPPPLNVSDPIIDRMIGRNIDTQPLVADVETELHALIADLQSALSACGTCGTDADKVENIMKGACAATLGSAAMLVQ